MSAYKVISTIGKSDNSILNNPLTYCLTQSLDNDFNHGSITQTVSGPYGKNCQAFMSEYCSKNGWDDICEIASKNPEYNHPNNLKDCKQGCTQPPLTAGEILIYNTASRKYLVTMLGNGYLTYEQFDPILSSSPYVRYWNGNNRIPVYAVDPSTIDNDYVMNKILNKPIIALDILVNIYNTAIRVNTINNLRNTKIYNFFMSNGFQSYINKKNNML